MTLNATSVLTIVQPKVVLADPHILSDIRDRRSIIDAIYDALVRRNDAGEFAPWLATGWTVDNRCRQWRFTLRTDVHFHSGARLNAGDVAASLRRALSPEMPGELGTEGVLRGYLEGVIFTVEDDHHLLIETRQPFADLLDLLVDIPVVQADALPERLIGSGPWQPLKQHFDTLIMQAFPQHWAGMPRVQTLIWRAEPDAERRLSMLEKGEADIAVDVPAREAEHTQLVKQKSYLCVIFLFNLLQGPMRDVRVRQAINYAVNLTDVINDPEVQNGQAEPLSGPLSPRHPGTPAALTPYPFDPARTRQLLAEAGYAAGLSLDISLPARFPDESIALAQNIARQLGEVGIQVNLSVGQDRPAYAHRVRDKQFGDACCFDSSPASAWRVYVEKLDSRRQGPWWQGYHSDELNAVLDMIAATPDTGQRAKLLEAAFARVHHDAPWLFLYAPDSVWALGEKAAGWQPSVEGRVRIIREQDVQ
ncbi:ABC transporter substrate-binding protein [Phytobacter sp. V91]|uniref:ABC transporter substrate-binding protein n=1 Tax=Phytobacter sp. V91 TaxID=3369425 RepID=UPI003F61C849